MWEGDNIAIAQRWTAHNAAHMESKVKAQSKVRDKEMLDWTCVEAPHLESGGIWMLWRLRTHTTPHTAQHERQTLHKHRPFSRHTTKQDIREALNDQLYWWEYNKTWNLFNRTIITDTKLMKKHCQRHNGPEGWVHITRSQFTKLDQITISESRLSINFKISIKHQHLDQT